MSTKKLLDMIDIEEDSFSKIKAAKFSITLSDNTMTISDYALKEHLVSMIRKKFSITEECKKTGCDNYDEQQPANCDFYQGIEACDYRWKAD